VPPETYSLPSSRNAQSRFHLDLFRRFFSFPPTPYLPALSSLGPLSLRHRFFSFSGGDNCLFPRFPLRRTWPLFNRHLPPVIPLPPTSDSTPPYFPVIDLSPPEVTQPFSCTTTVLFWFGFFYTHTRNKLVTSSLCGFFLIPCFVFFSSAFFKIVIATRYAQTQLNRAVLTPFFCVLFLGFHHERFSFDFFFAGSAGLICLMFGTPFSLFWPPDPFQLRQSAPLGVQILRSGVV